MPKAKKIQEIRVELDEPIEHGSEVITELIIRRPKGKDIKKLPADPDVGAILDWAGGLAGYPPSVVDELDCDDVEKLIDAATSFFESGQLIGGLSSAS